MLVQELIDLAASEDSSVVVMLRKCMILGHKLKNQSLVDWATRELQGYQSSQDVPSYRSVNVGAKGTLVGPFGTQVNNFPIPSSLLDKAHRQRATKLELREPIASYEELMNSDSSSFRMEWPSDLTLYYQDRVVTENGCHLIRAWQDISRSVFAQIFDAVKNRTLGMALELQSSMVNMENTNEITPQIAAAIDKTVTNNIYGGINVISSGQSNVHSSVSNSQNSLKAGDFTALSRLLTDGGLAENEVEQLQKAIEEDGPKRFGSKTTEWLKSTGPKLLVGGVKVGSSVAQAVLTEYLKQHFGLTHL